MLKDTLNPEELQTLTLLVGSRKALQTYLGMERKPFDELWNRCSLKAPTDYVRSLPLDQILSSLLSLGSIDKVAEFYGVSTSFLRSHVDILQQSKHRKLSDSNLTTQEVVNAVMRYGSVRLAARMTGFTEGEIRKVVKSLKLEHHLRYDFSNHNNAKGRRAETYWASLDPDNIMEDCNVTQGSQADYDYVHKSLGKVNVKSSAAHRYTAKTRKDNPWYWKFSSSGLHKADTVALVLYDAKMSNPLHVFNLAVTKEMLESTTFRVQLFRGDPRLIF